MKFRVLFTLVFLCLPSCLPSFLCAQVAPAANAPAAENAYDVASFQNELRRLSGVLQSKPASKTAAAELSGSLPSSWSVRATGQTYRISTEPLRDMLRTSSTQDAQEWITQLQSAVAGSQIPAATTPAARTELERILARKEFRGARAPGPWDEIRKRISTWLEKVFLWIFGRILRHPLGGQILFWLLVLAGVAVIALCVFRFLVSRDKLNTFRPEPASEMTRSWQEWIRMAREAASRGDFREAVHSAYWAGIARLEDLGAVPKDRTKTPREYLRYVSQSGLADAHPQRSPREPLKVLTSRMERIWYANRGAKKEDFHESLVQLEALGCRWE
jgi:hypothetical protein